MRKNDEPLHSLLTGIYFCNKKSGVRAIVFLDMLFTDEYHTIEGLSEGSFRDRGSRFLGIAIPILKESEVKEELEKIRKQYFDATHHCYAYVLGPDKSAWRANDDGEPSGTAGRQIYGQILSADLTNILVVVIRYYGGTKLGVSGLINAYKTATADALQNAVRKHCYVRDIYQLDYPYEEMDKVMKILKEDGVQIRQSDFGMKCVIQFAVRRNNSHRINDKLGKINSLVINHLMTI
jgi:uncharacterized YigZ family protein